MDIFHRFRPSAIFYTTLAIIPTLKYEPVNCSILTVVDYSVSRDGPIGKGGFHVPFPYCGVENDP